jgi:TonB family protein
MHDNRTFKYAVLVSLLFHSIIVLGLPRMHLTQKKRPAEKINVTYYKINKAPDLSKKIIKKAEPVVTKLPEIKKEDILAPPKSGGEKTGAKKIKEKIKKPEGSSAVKKIEEKKFEAVVNEEKDDAKKAAYISYYRAVREKIKKYTDINYPRNSNLGEGEVFLSFVIAASGELFEVRVIDGRSSADRILRDIAINSIRDASPFPTFPMGMSQYQITFNVVISFEIK